MGVDFADVWKARFMHGNEASISLIKVEGSFLFLTALSLSVADAFNLINLGEHGRVLTQQITP